MAPKPAVEASIWLRAELGMIVIIVFCPPLLHEAPLPCSRKLQGLQRAGLTPWQDTWRLRFDQFRSQREAVKESNEETT